MLVLIKDYQEDYLWKEKMLLSIVFILFYNFKELSDFTAAKSVDMINEKMPYA